MKYDVIATGSSGNAVIINDCVMIDCGVPFKALRGHTKPLKLVLLTHEHSDHFNPRTVRALHKERPALRWGCCEWMVKHLLTEGVPAKLIDVYTPGRYSIYKGLCTILPEALTHNVPNCGYHAWIGEDSLFYATDTGTLDGIKAPRYDLYLIEANHTRAEIASRIEEKRAAGDFAYEYKASENHLSREQAEDWIYANIGPNGRYAFLHQHEEKAD